MHFYNADAQVYHDCEPAQYGSTCLPVNWTGKSEERKPLPAGPQFACELLQLPGDGFAARLVQHRLGGTTELK